MNQLPLLFLGALATMFFAAVILVTVPRAILPIPPQNAPLEPYERGENPLQPYTAAELAGRKVYL